MTSTSSQFTGSIGTVSEKGIPDEVDVVDRRLRRGRSDGSAHRGQAGRPRPGRGVPRARRRRDRHLGRGSLDPQPRFLDQAARRSSDDLDQARRYIYGQGRDQVLDHALVEKFLETGPHVARYIEEHTAFGWIPTIWPDYRSDIDGASIGRALFPGPYSPEGLGEAAKYVRPALTTGMAKNPLPFWLLGGMGIDEAWLAGPALVGALLEAGLRNGVDVRVEAPAVRLVTDDGRSARRRRPRRRDRTRPCAPRRGVVLASGGFESSTELTTDPPRRALRRAGLARRATTASPSSWREEIGADLTGMQDAWWMPGVQLPGEELEGRPLSRVFLGERALPHSIMVNSKGERFANEALAYDQFGAIMREVDPETGTMPNATAWLIFDQTYWDKFGIFGITPGGEVPDYLHRADTLVELAAQIGVDEAGCGAPSSGSTPSARRARDPEFQRGDTLFDRYFGAYYPRLGSILARRTVPRRHREGPRSGSPRLIGPVVEQARRTRSARATTPRSCGPSSSGRWRGSSAPCSKSPRSSVLGPVDDRALLRPEGRGQRAGHGRRSPDRCARPGTRHRRQASSPACTPRATPAAPHEGLLRRRRRDHLPRPGLRLPRRTRKPPSTAPAETRKASFDRTRHPSVA